jgi:transcription antitermination factor NusA-like protein
VYSRDRNVDPVGACVGPKGSRVQAVVDELRGEKIDIIPWAGDPAQFVASALQPAKVVRVEINEETKTANVIVPDNQLSLAIGREGQNARLAAKLTGWRIDIKSEKQMREAEAAKLFVDLTPEELAAYDAGTDAAAQARAPDEKGEPVAAEKGKADGEGDGTGPQESQPAEPDPAPVQAEKSSEAEQEDSGSGG